MPRHEWSYDERAFYVQSVVCKWSELYTIIKYKYTHTHTWTYSHTFPIRDDEPKLRRKKNTKIIIIQRKQKMKAKMIKLILEFIVYHSFSDECAAQHRFGCSFSSHLTRMWNEMKTWNMENRPVRHGIETWNESKMKPHQRNICLTMEFFTFLIKRKMRRSAYKTTKQAWTCACVCLCALNEWCFFMHSVYENTQLSVDRMRSNGKNDQIPTENSNIRDMFASSLTWRTENWSGCPRLRSAKVFCAAWSCFH